MLAVKTFNLLPLEPGECLLPLLAPTHGVESS